MLRVITPPDPIVTADDLQGSRDDAQADAVIAAVTQSIDGPGGWLGRALGEQTLELSLCEFDVCKIRLPCRPIIEVVSISYLDQDGAEQTLDDGIYRLVGHELFLAPNQHLPETGAYPDAVRIRYRAGYDGNDADDGGTGEVPAVAKQAIIISAQHLLNVGAENLFLSTDTVDGIGTRQYVVSDQATQLIETTCERLLQGLKVYA